MRLAMQADGLELRGHHPGRRPGPRGASTPSTRAPSSRWRSTPSTCSTGSRSTPGDEVTLETLDALEAGADPHRREPRLPVPADARPGLLSPAAVGPCSSSASGSPTSGPTRRPSCRSRRGSPWSLGANGAGQDQPARGRRLPGHAVVVPGRADRGAGARTGAEQAVVRAEGERDGRALLRRGRARRQRAATGCRSTASRCTRARDLLGALRVTVFSPDDLELVKGGPGRAPALPRRHARGSPPPLRRAAQRPRPDPAPAQHAAASRPAAGSTPSVAATLDVWDAKLAEAGEALADARAGARRATWRRCWPRPTTQVAGRAGRRARRPTTAPWRERRAWPRRSPRPATDDLRRGVSTGRPAPRRARARASAACRPAPTPSQGEQRSLALALRLAAHRVVTEVTGSAAGPAARRRVLRARPRPQRRAARPPARRARRCSRPPAASRRAPSPSWSCGSTTARSPPRLSRCRGGCRDAPARPWRCRCRRAAGDAEPARAASASRSTAWCAASARPRPSGVHLVFAAGPSVVGDGVAARTPARPARRRARSSVAVDEPAWATQLRCLAGRAAGPARGRSSAPVGVTALEVRVGARSSRANARPRGWSGSSHPGW